MASDASDASDARIVIEIRDGVISTFVTTLTSKDQTSLLAARAAEVAPTGGRLQLMEISSRGMQVVMSYLRGSIDTSAARRTLRALDDQVRAELVNFARGQRLDGLLALLERRWSRLSPHQR